MMAISNIPAPEEKNRPSYLSPAYRAMHPELQIVRDVDGGYLRMREKATLYLPQHPRERNDDYQIRLKRPVFFNGFTRTHIGLTGMVFRIEPTLAEDVPKPIMELWENIDNQGTHGNVFLKGVFDDGIVTGHGAILVDVPTVDNPKAIRTKADELKAGVRPYWLYVPKDDILNIRTTIENGQIKLTLAVIREIVEEIDGSFGTEQFLQYRVLRRENGKVTFELWRNIEGREIIYQPARVITNVTEIPLIPFYTGKTGFFSSRPPLIDLAHANILHYQTSSDMHHAAHIANVPLLFTKGFAPGSIETGPNSALCVPQGGPDIDAKWLETTGAGIGLTRQILQDIEAHMAVLGLNMLVRETRAAETAEAKRLDKSEQDSALASAARSLQDAAEQALIFTAQFMRLPQGGSISVNRDFLLEPMTPQLMAEYRNMVAANQLSLDTMWAILEENGALPDDFDPDIEKEQIEAGSMAFMPPQLVVDDEDEDEEDEEEAEE